MNSNIKVIGLSGKAGSGKDFIAQKYLRPMGYYPISLAWPFKIWSVGLGKATYDEVFITKPPHIRHLLQQMGTELGRNKYGIDVWVNTVFATMETLYNHWGFDKFVIPDVRFKNEKAAIQKLSSGVVWRILAPNRINNSGLSAEARQHQSEIDLDDVPTDSFDLILHNDYGYEQTIEPQIRRYFGYIPFSDFDDSNLEIAGE